MKENQKGFSEVILILIVVVLVGVVGFFVYQNNQLESEVAVTESSDVSEPVIEVTNSPTGTLAPTSDPTTDWKTYTYAIYNYKFSYPNMWKFTPDSPLSIYTLEDGLPVTKITIYTNELDSYGEPGTTGWDKICEKLEDCVSEVTKSITEDFSLEKTTFYNTSALTTTYVVNKNNQPQKIKHVFAILNDDFYNFKFVSQQNVFDNKVQVFDKVLSTFEFTN